MTTERIDDLFARARAAGALADGLAFVAPTRWQGRDVGRLVFLHPDTSTGAVDDLLERLVAGG